MVFGGVYLCLLPGHVCVVLLHSACVCKHVCAPIAKVLGGGGGGGLCTFHFGVLAVF